jgi:hypothetical protein
VRPKARGWPDRRRHGRAGFRFAPAGVGPRANIGTGTTTGGSSMAVGVVGGELVSGGDSLSIRERTGKVARFRHRRGRLSRDSSTDPVAWKGIPYELEQGIFRGEHGTPEAEQGIDAPCSHLSANSVKFAAVARLLRNRDTVRGRTEISPRCLPDEY